MIYILILELISFQNVNDHWDNLYTTALKWQNKLQSEFLQSSEFKSTIDEMRLWLEESESRLNEMALVKERNETVLHAQHTELFVSVALHYSTI